MCQGISPFPVVRYTDEQKMKTQSDYMITRVIHEPVSGNIILTGYENGEVKLFDLRQNRSTSLLQWNGCEPLPGVTVSSRNIRKVGMALGQSSHISSAA
jgi:regulator-associated protein of mTOR